MAQKEPGGMITHYVVRCRLNGLYWGRDGGWVQETSAARDFEFMTIALYEAASLGDPDQFDVEPIAVDVRTVAA